MLRPKKNSYKECDKEKKFLRLKNSPPSPPPITFLMVRPLQSPESIPPTVSDIRDAQNHGTTDTPTLSSYEDEDQRYAV